MKKICLIFPPPAENYWDVVWSVKDAPSPPQTAPTELGAYVRAHASSLISYTSINSQTTEREKVRYYTIDEITSFCANSDIVGLTCLYHNQETAHRIAESIKEQDPSKIVVLGGQNVSSTFMARQILNQIPSVDYVVVGEGEDALLGLVENRPLAEVPNLVYRKNGKIMFTRRKSVNMDTIPTWDYEDTLNYETILEAHDSRTQLYQELVRKYGGRTPGEIGVFSQRGCAKAFGEIGNHKGPCRFCTSSETSRSKMNPEHFWRQLELLHNKYGLQDFFITDNVFGVSLDELRKLKETRIDFEIPDSVQFRAYTYPIIINGKEGTEIAKSLRNLGVINIFLGVETFSREVSLLANKDPATLESIGQAIETLGRAGIDTFVSFMPGLQGESRESLQWNLDCLERLLSSYSSKKYGNGNLTRVDISPAMPLVGTAWHTQLVKDELVKKDYFKETGRYLEKDLAPDFNILRALSLRYHSSITEGDVKEFEMQAKRMCIEYMKPDMVGGFDLKKSDVERIQALSQESRVS